jgi:hypothetical protein
MESVHNNPPFNSRGHLEITTMAEGLCNPQDLEAAESEFSS